MKYETTSEEIQFDMTSNKFLAAARNEAALDLDHDEKVAKSLLRLSGKLFRYSNFTTGVDRAFKIQTEL